MNFEVMNSKYLSLDQKRIAEENSDIDAESRTDNNDDPI